MCGSGSLFGRSCTRKCSLVWRVLLVFCFYAGLVALCGTIFSRRLCFRQFVELLRGAAMLLLFELCRRSKRWLCTYTGHVDRWTDRQDKGHATSLRRTFKKMSCTVVSVLCLSKMTVPMQSVLTFLVIFVINAGRSSCFLLQKLPRCQYPWRDVHQSTKDHSHTYRSRTTSVTSASAATSRQVPTEDKLKD